MNYDQYRLKARRKNSLVVWAVVYCGPSLVTVSSGQHRDLISRVEFDRDWIPA